MNDEQLWNLVRRACNLHPNAPITEQLLAQFRYVTESAIRFHEANKEIDINKSWVELGDRAKVILIRNSPNWTALQLIEETEAILKEKNA